jgi:hypothetical protein
MGAAPARRTDLAARHLYRSRGLVDRSPDLALAKASEKHRRALVQTKVLA